MIFVLYEERKKATLERPIWRAHTAGWPVLENSLPSQHLPFPRKTKNRKSKPFLLILKALQKNNVLIVVYLQSSRRVL